MPRFRAILAYDGTAYNGFQRQLEGIPTVQAAVEDALKRIVGDMVAIVAAGRTDSGVHATGQVIAFDVRWSRGEAELLRALNAVLPDDIALQTLGRAADDFHPRYDALSRRYTYTVMQSAQRQPLWIRRAWWVRQPLDLDAVNEAASLFIGRHDFASFGHPPQGENTVREVFASSWERKAHPSGVEYCYTVEATAFLHHMVRRMVGLLVDVGRGWVTQDAARGVLNSADIRQAPRIAPPAGLVLEKVRYPDED